MMLLSGMINVKIIKSFNKILNSKSNGCTNFKECKKRKDIR